MMVNSNSNNNNNRMLRLIYKLGLMR